MLQSTCEFCTQLHWAPASWHPKGLHREQPAPEPAAAAGSLALGYLVSEQLLLSPRDAEKLERSR